MAEEIVYIKNNEKMHGNKEETIDELLADIRRHKKEMEEISNSVRQARIMAMDLFGALMLKEILYDSENCD